MCKLNAAAGAYHQQDVSAPLAHENDDPVEQNVGDRRYRVVVFPDRRDLFGVEFDLADGGVRLDDDVEVSGNRYAVVARLLRGGAAGQQKTAQKGGAQKGIKGASSLVGVAVLFLQLK